MPKYLHILLFFIVSLSLSLTLSAVAYDTTEENTDDESVLSEIIEQAVLSSYQKLIYNSYVFYKRHLRFHDEIPVSTIKNFPVIIQPSYNNETISDQPYYSTSYFRNLYAASRSHKTKIESTKLVKAKTKVIKISNAPVDEGYVSSGFGIRKDPILGVRQMHKGIDIAASMGSKVNPLGPGEVVFSGYKPGYGNTVEIKHGRTVITRYAHLQKYLVDTGQKVIATDIIGLIGSTGRSTGPHLHLEVLFNNEQVDPQVFLVNHYGSGTYNYAKLAQVKNKKAKLARSKSIDLVKNNNTNEKNSVDVSADKIDSSQNAPQVAYQDYVNSINGLYGFSAPVSFER